LPPGSTSPRSHKEKSIMSAQPDKLRGNQRTILIVDDFDDTRLLLRTWLEKKGYRVLEAGNGNEAVAEAESSVPDLIIMDVEMPELDGLAATRKIRSLKKLEGLPIVAVSAYGADQFRADALSAGCNEYVSTPFEPDELENLIHSLIER
jgi:CheY-like chemotaxis protein